MCDTWHVTPDMWNLEAGENSLQIVASQVLRFFEDIFTKDESLSKWFSQSQSCL